VSPPFKLVKWYLDCVTDEGDAIILYCAELHWRGFHTAYSSVLTTQGQAVTARSSMSRYRLCANQDRIEVELPRLQVDGEWKATAEAVQRTVFEGPAGSVQWNCLQPGALARVQLGDRQLIGLGYAECLTLTVPPWQLPMQQFAMGAFRLLNRHLGMDRLAGALPHLAGHSQWTRAHSAIGLGHRAIARWRNVAHGRGAATPRWTVGLDHFAGSASPEKAPSSFSLQH